MIRPAWSPAEFFRMAMHLALGTWGDTYHGLKKEDVAKLEQQFKLQLYTIIQAEQQQSVLAAEAIVLELAQTGSGLAAAGAGQALKMLKDRQRATDDAFMKGEWWEKGAY